MKLKAVSGIMLKLLFTGVLMLALDIQQVEVAASEGPIAFFVYVPATVYSGDTITFDANDSYDPDGYIANYTWDFDDGSPIITTSNPVTTHIYLVGLTYNVTLTVTDNDGLTDTEVYGVEVIPHCRHLHIWADGRIDPPTINITTVDNVTYIFTGNTYGNLYVERNNIVIDGVGYTLQGPGIYEGIALAGMSNITIKNIRIQAFDYGIYLHDSYNNFIFGNNATDNVWGIGLGNSFNNTIYHNNFVDNTAQTLSVNSTNIWDNGYPSGGNYWSNYNGTDFYCGLYQNETGSDGIGDTPYVIDVNNTDRYPLMEPFVAQPSVDWWPMLGHDPSHTGYSTSTAPNTNNTIWNSQTGGSVFSSPAVVDDRIFVASWDGKVYCLNATTGIHIWNYTTGNWVWSSPAVAYGLVYIGARDNNFYAFNATTGTKVWNYTTGGWVDSSPAIADGKVYVGSDDSKVYCLDALTGVHLWNYTTGGGVYSSPAVAHGRVYIGSSFYDSKVYCLDALTGAHLWNYTTGGGLHTPTVVEGRVYVGSSDHKVYAINATTGIHIWNYTTGGMIESCPAVADGLVFVSSQDRKVYSLNATIGTKVWNYTTGGGVYSSPAVAHGRVYVGSNDYNIYCLNAETGLYVWSYTTGSNVTSSPAVADGKVYVGSLDNKVYAFGPSSPPVGGISIPVDKLTLLAPYIGVAMLLAVAVVTVVYVKKRKTDAEIIS